MRVDGAGRRWCGGLTCPCRRRPGRPTPVMNLAASEARKTTASAMSSTWPRRPDGVSSMTAPTAASGEREQPELGDVVGQPGAHRGGDEPGVDAVDAHAVAELARLHGGDPGQPVDGRLRGRVDRDAGEGDRRGDRGDVDDAAALAGRAARAHRAQAVLEAERGAEDVDLEHRRTSAASTSVTRLVISMPALLTRMSSPPSCSTVSATAASQLASSVTSSRTKPWCPSPSRLGGCSRRRPGCRRSSRVAPAAASATAIPSPRPWAPPVTSAVRPVRSIESWRAPLPAAASVAARWGASRLGSGP